MIESVLIISDQSPIGKNSAAEAIRIGSGFVALGEYIECKIVFMGDAVYLLSKNAFPEAVGMDSMNEVLEMADLSDLELYVIDSSLYDAGLTKEDLIEYENLKIINFDELIELIEDANTCFRF
ncbi:MAG: DsrE family protein [Candidatus Hermodarchaeota archaeon]